MVKHGEAPLNPGQMNINCVGFEVVEKVAKPCATSARVLVPKHWIGKKVLVIRIEA